MAVSYTLPTARRRGRHALGRALLVAAAFLAAAILVKRILTKRVAMARVATTNASIALSNLESQITSVEKLMAQYPERPELKRQYFKLISSRTQVLGTYSDFAKLERLTLPSPSKLEDLLLRAKFLTIVHRFNEAKTMLDAAEQIAPKNVEIKRQRIAIGLALRDRLTEVRDLQQNELVNSRSYGNLLIMAAIESELGNFEQADNYIAEAIKDYRDSSPFPLALLFFQRGLLWAEKAGNAERGRQYYEEAVHYLPQYVVAQVHLAEIEGKIGDAASAEARLLSVVASEDPEPRGLLSAFLTKDGKLSEASAMSTSATNDYDKLLAAYPYAFADHGAEFFMRPGANPSRALELAKLNLSNRKSERAYLVAIEAARAAASLKDLCTFFLGAKALSPVQVPLQNLLQEVGVQCVGN